MEALEKLCNISYINHYTWKQKAISDFTESLVEYRENLKNNSSLAKFLSSDITNIELEAIEAFQANLELHDPATIQPFIDSIKNTSTLITHPTIQNFEKHNASITSLKYCKNSSILLAGLCV